MAGFDPKIATIPLFKTEMKLKMLKKIIALEK